MRGVQTNSDLVAAVKPVSDPQEEPQDGIHIPFAATAFMGPGLGDGIDDFIVCRHNALRASVTEGPKWDHGRFAGPPQGRRRGWGTQAGSVFRRLCQVTGAKLLIVAGGAAGQAKV